MIDDLGAFSSDRDPMTYNDDCDSLSESGSYCEMMVTVTVLSVIPTALTACTVNCKGPTARARR